MEESEFKSSLWWLYPLLVQLIPTGNPAVRRGLRGIFEYKLPAVLPLATPEGMEDEDEEDEDEQGEGGANPSVPSASV